MCKDIVSVKFLFISLQEILFHVALEALEDNTTLNKTNKIVKMHLNVRV